MRVLIVGASGFIGRYLRGAFGPQAVGTYCNHPVEGHQQLDIRDAAAVAKLVSAVQPQLILHPAAQPFVDWCENHVEESHAVNVSGTRNVAAAARTAGARYVFFSTDYVFNGDAGPYGEDAEPDPLNVYGRHKLDAERIIADTLEDHLILRLCNVYGFDPAGTNSVMTMLKRSRNGEPLPVPSDQWANPSHGDTLVGALQELAQSTERGILHVAGPEYFDRVSFAHLACATLGLDPGFLRPRTTAELGQSAPRPLRGGLESSKARAVLTTPLLGPKQGLEQVKLRMQEAGMLP